ncbi:MAG: hypothetical protein K0S74_1383 [Chlamydiales bacterium]|jgi:NAD-dependent deacetylase|nr:hypothetical protein [Chlamydiales bacterium]
MEQNVEVGGSNIQGIMGAVAKPLIIEREVPQSSSLQHIAHLIESKKVVFYTGAGISAGVVLTMPELMQQLSFNDLKNGESAIKLLKSVLDNPEQLVQAMDKFYHSCIDGEPTKAHWAERNISLLKKWGVLTENLDLLHQRTGIEPLNHNQKDWLKTNISPSDLKQIEYVITIGLATDESGFLNWYKQNNPNGVIIALNLSQPIQCAARFTFFPPVEENGQIARAQYNYLGGGFNYQVQRRIEIA